MKLPVVVGSLLAFWGSLFFLYQQPQPQAETESSASIAGKVTFRGSAVQGVSILVIPAPSGHEQTSSTRSTNNGEYKITNLRPGRYTVRVQAPGLVSPEQSAGVSGREVMLAPGETRESIDFALVRGGVITGRVTDFSGKPVVEERMTVTAATSNTGQPYVSNLGMMTTDDRGVYRIYGLPPGRQIGMGEADFESLSESGLWADLLSAHLSSQRSRGIEGGNNRSCRRQ